MSRYIGARYVPKFMGVFDPTQEYDNLCVVDNGSGTSYISKKIVPPGTSLTDTEYWALYGASSGAIISLQNQINDMQDGTVPGSLQSQINDMKDIVVTPEMFGAAGDGVTDDTQAVKDAIDFGGNIYVENKYYITDVIEYTKSIHVFGSGTFVVRSGKPLFFCQSGNTISGVTFEGFTIEGDGVTPTEMGGGPQAVIANYSGAINIQNFRVDNVRFIDVSFGVYLNANNGGIFRNAVVENCYFKNIFGSLSGNGDGVAIANRQGDCGAIAIRNNFFDDCGRHSIYCSYAKNVTITGNTIVNHGYSNGTQIATNAAINIARSEDIVISDNFIEKNQNTSIQVVDIGGNSCGNVQVVNNIILDKIGDAVDISVGSDSPDVNGGVYNVSVRGNTIVLPASASSQRCISVASGNHIQIENNILNLSKANVSYSQGIVLYAYGSVIPSDDYTINNNIIIIDPAVANTRGITLQNNICTGTALVKIYNNNIQASQPVQPLSGVTNPNVYYTTDILFASAYISALGAGASLADVITKVNDIITNFKTAGLIKT